MIPLTGLRLYRFKADMVVMADSAQDAMLIVATSLIASTEGDEQNEGLVEGKMEMRLLERDS